MSEEPTSDIRGLVLEVIREQSPLNPADGNLQTGSVLAEVNRRLVGPRDILRDQAALSVLHDLFRTGYLAWGHNLHNPNPPFFHVTEYGRRHLASLARDPGNPAGYKAHLYSVATVNAVARSYVEESIECYVAGLPKAAAVMVGASAECLILELRDELLSKIQSLGKKSPKDLDDWRVKRILEAMHGFLTANRGTMSSDLKDEFEAYWAAFAQQIRAIRNDAGHPTSVNPVTPDTVHASLLIYPELVKLQNKLLNWVRNDLR